MPYFGNRVSLSNLGEEDRKLISSIAGGIPYEKDYDADADADYDEDDWDDDNPHPEVFRQGSNVRLTGVSDGWYSIPQLEMLARALAAVVKDSRAMMDAECRWADIQRATMTPKVELCDGMLRSAEYDFGDYRVSFSITLDRKKNCFVRDATVSTIKDGKVQDAELAEKVAETKDVSMVDAKAVLRAYLMRKAEGAKNGK